jgi:integrase
MNSNSRRGMGSIYQQTGDTWWISYYVHGKRHRESSGSTNRADAVRLLKRRLGESAAGKPVGNQVERTRLKDLTEMVVADYRANGRRSIDRVEQAIAHLHRFFGDDCKARDLTTDRITGYQAARLEDRAKPSTVNYEVAMLRRGFRLATRAGKISQRPEIDMLHVENARKGFFEPDQYRAVLTHLPDYLQPVAAVAYITGWRVQSELLTRHWRHVDLTKGWLRLEPGETKNGEGREFPFTADLRSILHAQRERVREIEKATGAIIPWVFVHPLGGARTAAGSPIKDFRGAWKAACEAAAVPGRLVHDFRRTAVRNLERAGVPRSAAMKLTGHKTEAVYRRYAIVDKTMLEEAAIKLGALHVAEANSHKSVMTDAGS